MCGTNPWPEYLILYGHNLTESTKLHRSTRVDTPPTSLTFTILGRNRTDRHFSTPACVFVGLTISIKYRP